MRLHHLTLLIGIGCCLTAAAEEPEYKIPVPKFNLLQPRGFSVSIPDEHGIQLFAFHGNLNKEMQDNGSGRISGDVSAKSRGKWVFQNKTTKVKPGDVMNYWVFVIKDRRGYIEKNLSYTWRDEDFKKLMKKTLTHGIKKRHAYRNRFHGHHHHSDDYDNDYGNEYEYRHPHPFHMRPFKYPQFNPYFYCHREETTQKPADSPTQTVSMLPIAVPVTSSVAPVTPTKPSAQAETTFPLIDVRFGE